MRPLYYDSSRVVDARARLTRDRPRGRIGPTEVTMNGAANERQELNISKLTPHIGAEVHGVDLSRPLDEPTFKRVHDALIDNQVIFFRDQHITPDQQKAFGRASASWRCIPPRPGSWKGTPRSWWSTPTRSPGTWRERTGTPTSPATPSRRWAASSICTSCRRSGATPSSPACTRPTRRSPSP